MEPWAPLPSARGNHAPNHNDPQGPQLGGAPLPAPTPRLGISYLSSEGVLAPSWWHPSLAYLFLLGVR